MASLENDDPTSPISHKTENDTIDKNVLSMFTNCYKLVSEVNKIHNELLLKSPLPAGKLRKSSENSEKENETQEVSSVISTEKKEPLEKGLEESLSDINRILSPGKTPQSKPK